MCRYNIVSRILIILTVATFALAAPVLVQEKRQVYVDVVHAPKDVINVSENRRMDPNDGLNIMWDAILHPENAWNHNPVAVHLQEPEPPLNPAEPEPPLNPADPDRESIELDDDAPPGSPESGDSHSPPTSPDPSTASEDWRVAPTSPESSTASEDWHMAPTSPESSTESEDWHMAPSGLESSTESDADRGYWPTNSEFSES
jgi:hypothetical protein